MSQRCQACGFESPAEAPYCDFCKEPFRPKTPKPPPSVPQSASPKPAAPANLLELPEEALAKLPPGFVLKDEEKVPSLPRWLRWAAWAFLGLWLLAGAIVAGAWLAHYVNRAP